MTQLYLNEMFILIYLGFATSGEKHKSSNPLQYMKMVMRKMLLEGLVNMSLFIEARNVLLDEQVYRSTVAALKEFRIAHPPKFKCTIEHCDKCFLTKRDLDNHIKHDVDLHVQQTNVYLSNMEKFKVLEPLFKGNKLMMYCICGYCDSFLVSITLYFLVRQYV